MINRFMLLGALALSSTSALAAEKYVCLEYSRDTQKIKQTIVVLTPAEKGELREGVPMKYLLETYVGAGQVPTLEAEGTVETEDVMFNFTSKDKKVSFHIYLDEMYESGLTVSGKDKGDFVCH